MAARTRVAALALLTVGAITVLRARTPGAGRETAEKLVPEDADAAVTWLMMLTVPFLLLLLVLAVSNRRERPAPEDPGWSRSTTKGLLFAVASVVLLTVVVAVAARIGGPKPAPEPETPRARPGTPPPPAPEARRTPGSSEDTGGLDFDLIAGFVVVALAVLLVSAWLARGRLRRPDPPDEDVTAPRIGKDPPVLVTAARSALSAVDAPAQDARTAIIRCYAAWERALGEAPGAVPQPADTASEVLRRAADAGIVRQEDGGRLVDLFTEARFSPHPMTEGHRADAAAALRLILADLEGAIWTRS